MMPGEIECLSFRRSAALSRLPWMLLREPRRPPAPASASQLSARAVRHLPEPRGRVAGWWCCER
jgi:hypothetical protein